MKRWPLAVLLGAALAAAGGCASRTVLSELPDPVFGTARQSPPTAKPKPTYTTRRPPTPAPPPRATAVRRPTVPPGWFPPGGISPRWKCVVIHHSAGDVGGAKAFDRYHRNVRKWDELGYHFVIGNGSNTGDGQIEVGSRWTKQKHGAHCKTADNFYNQCGIGICLVGNFEKHSPTPAQMASLTRLVDYLMGACHIDAAHIYTHGGVTHHTACPGRYFSLGSLKARLHATALAAHSRH